MDVKRCLIGIDHFFTERMNHWIEQIRYGREIDFSIPGGGIKGEKDYVSYQATVLTDRKILRFLSISRGDSILDIGCGKGKMVFFFHKLGFGKSDGIDFSKKLVDCARYNMKILKTECSIINADAIDFCGYANYNYFYLGNPFGKQTMHLVMDKIEESFRKKPRKITIIYYNPLCHEEIVESGFFHMVYSDENFYRRVTGRIINIYSNEAVHTKYSK